MDVDYGPALPPRLVPDPHDTSDQYVATSELPPKNFKSRTNPKSIATLAVGMKLNPGLPRINLMRNPMNLGSHLLNLKSTLIRVNTNQGPDMGHLPQGRISPLLLDTGLLSPLGLSPQGLFLMKTSLNMIQNPLIIGK